MSESADSAVSSAEAQPESEVEQNERARARELLSGPTDVILPVDARIRVEPVREGPPLKGW